MDCIFCGIDRLQTLDINKLRAKFSQMEQKKKELQQAYQTAEKESRQLERKLEQYLGSEPNTVSMQKHSKKPAR